MSRADKRAAKKQKADACKQASEAFATTMLWCEKGVAAPEASGELVSAQGASSAPLASASLAGAEEGPFVEAGASSAPLAIPQDAAAAAAQEATAAAAQEAVAAKVRRHVCQSLEPCPRLSHATAVS